MPKRNRNRREWGGQSYQEAEQRRANLPLHMRIERPENMRRDGSQSILMGAQQPAASFTSTESNSSTEGESAAETPFWFNDQKRRALSYSTSEATSSRCSNSFLSFASDEQCAQKVLSPVPASFETTETDSSAPFTGLLSALADGTEGYIECDLEHLERLTAHVPTVFDLLNDYMGENGGAENKIEVVDKFSFLENFCGIATDEVRVGTINFLAALRHEREALHRRTHRIAEELCRKLEFDLLAIDSSAIDLLIRAGEIGEELRSDLFFVEVDFRNIRDKNKGYRKFRLSGALKDVKNSAREASGKYEKRMAELFQK